MNIVKKVIFALPNMTSGGAERVVSILANNLINKGVEVEIWLYYGSKLHYSLDNRVRIYSLGLLDVPILKRIAVIHHKLKQTKKNENSLVFVPFLGAILNISVVANIGTGIPLVACERNNPYIHGKKWFQKIRAQLPFLMASHCVFQTPDARTYYSFVKNKHCTVIVNPISKSKYIWEGNVSALKLISVCRLHKQKNLPMSLEVISLLKDKFPNIHLDIYGDGELKDYIEKEIFVRGLTNHIALKGVTKEVPLTLSKYSVFMSTSDFEGISNSMLEAMSVGMPIICTDCPIGGARLMLNNGAGVLTPITDAKKFAESLEELLKNPIKAAEFGHKAKETTLQYTDEKITNIWLSVFNKLLS